MFEMMKLFDRRWYILFFAILISNCNPERALVTEGQSEPRASEERIVHQPNQSQAPRERIGPRPTIRPANLDRKNID